MSAPDAAPEVYIVTALVEAQRQLTRDDGLTVEPGETFRKHFATIQATPKQALRRFREHCDELGVTIDATPSVQVFAPDAETPADVYAASRELIDGTGGRGPT